MTQDVGPDGGTEVMGLGWLNETAEITPEQWKYLASFKSRLPEQLLMDRVVAHQMSLPENQKKIRQAWLNYPHYGNSLGGVRRSTEPPTNANT